jgi:hypothetical protein
MADDPPEVWRTRGVAVLTGAVAIGRNGVAADTPSLRASVALGFARGVKMAAETTSEPSLPFPYNMSLCRRERHQPPVGRPVR